MQPVDTLVTARWVVPVEPAGTVLEDHAVAIQGGRIVAVLPADVARTRFDAREVIDRPTHVLLPGLVNAHTHAAMVLLRGRAENLPLGRWLRAAVWPMERRWIDEEYVRDGTSLAIAEMLRGGITCFADMHLFPDAVAQTAAAAGMRASVGLIVTEAATRWASTRRRVHRPRHAPARRVQGRPVDRRALRAARALLRIRRHPDTRAATRGRTRPAGRDAPARDGLGDRGRASRRTGAGRWHGSRNSGSPARS